MSKGSLGLVPVPDGTFEHDLAILEKYQDYSAELLRLALLGLTAIGLAVFQALTLEPEESAHVLASISGARPWIAASLVLFVGAALGALCHRYCSADSLGWHLQAIRRYVRLADKDLESGKAEMLVRLRRFKQSQWALGISAAMLGLGAAALAVALMSAVW